LALDAVEGADPAARVLLFRTLARGRCLYVRAFPAAPDALGRPARRFHLVWLAPDQMRALGRLPWRLDSQLPHLDRITGLIGQISVLADPPPGAVPVAPEHLCEAVAAVERLRAGEPVALPVGDDLRFVLVWLAVSALDLPGVALRVCHREAVFTAPVPVHPDTRSDPPAPGPSRWGRFALAGAVLIGSVLASAAVAGAVARFVPSLLAVGFVGAR
jgi:hypothetical protein